MSWARSSFPVARGRRRTDRGVTLWLGIHQDARSAGKGKRGAGAWGGASRSQPDAVEMRHTAGHLPLYREKARERRQPAREGDQRIGGNGLHGEDEGCRVGRLDREERAAEIGPEGVVDKPQMHGRPIRRDQRAEAWAVGRRQRSITILTHGGRRPGGPKRHSRNSTHEERPAGPRGWLSHEADAHLPDRVHRPSGR